MDPSWASGSGLLAYLMAPVVADQYGDGAMSQLMAESMGFIGQRRECMIVSTT